MIALFVIAGLLAAGFLVQILGDHFDSKRYPCPGRLVELPDGPKLHVYKLGNPAEPTVVFEAGIAGSCLGWTLVQPLVAEFAHAVSYDRAGLGWSAGPLTPRTVPTMVEELASVLRLAQLKPPYILVGHSFGTVLIQAFAHAHPAETAAVVMVDPVTQIGWAEAGGHQVQRLNAGVRLSRRGALLARFGVVRLALTLLVSGNLGIPKLLARASAGQGNSVIHRLIEEVRKLPAEAQPIVGAHWSKAKSFLSMAAHLESLPGNARFALSMPVPSEVPLTVLSAATATPAEIVERDLWVARNSHPRHSQIESTGHWLQLERPELVVAAVREAILRVR